MNSKWKAFGEVTLMAGFFFVVPAVYFTQRDNILRMQDRAYNRFFGISEA